MPGERSPDVDRADAGVAAVVDQLVTADVARRGAVGPIAEAVAASHEVPPPMRAAERLLDAVEPGDTVVLLTGFPIPPSMRPETDGPPGVASLARALVGGLDANPVIACEPMAVAVCEAAATAAGLRVLERDPDAADAGAVAVEGFPVDRAEAGAFAGELVDRDPAAVVAVEKPGPNRAGVYHDMTGADVTAACAKVDELSDRLAGSVPTVAVGDGGNEVGMGTVEATVRRAVEHGETCRCDCGAGIACATGADVLVPAAVSNWGAYGIAGCLSARLERPLLHAPAVERRMLAEAGAAGAVDGVSGESTGACDGLPPAVHAAVVRLLRAGAGVSDDGDDGR